MESCKITYIYGLYEVGKEDIIRYVGKSINPKQRFPQHVKRSKTNQEKIKWINDVSNRGGKIGIKIIEECKENWQEREKYWISEYKKLGLITNVREGGQNGKYYKISYSDCKKWVKENLKGIDTLKKWQENSPNLPDFIPKCPPRVFPEFEYWGDFLGTGKRHNIELTKNYMTYEEAKKCLKFLKIKSIKHWIEKFNNGLIPKNLPKKPNRFYSKRGWISWGDFLSNGNIQKGKIEYISFNECKKLANDNEILSRKKWNEFVLEKKILNAPKAPHLFYKEWVSWQYFLNKSTKCIKFEYLSYDESRKFLSQFNLKSLKDFKKFNKNKSKIYKIPGHPNEYYKEWVSWSHFLTRGL